MPDISRYDRIRLSGWWLPVLHPDGLMEVGSHLVLGAEHESDCDGLSSPVPPVGLRVVLGVGALQVSGRDFSGMLAAHDCPEDTLVGHDHPPVPTEALLRMLPEVLGIRDQDGVVLQDLLAGSERASDLVTHPKPEVGQSGLQRSPVELPDGSASSSFGCVKHVPRSVGAVREGIARTEADRAASPQRAVGAGLGRGCLVEDENRQLSSSDDGSHDHDHDAPNLSDPAALLGG